MNVLEKILEEIKQPTNYTIMCGKHFTTVDRVEDIIRSHMDELPNGIKEVSKEQLNQIPVAINKWTPVSELPTEKGWYLCTCSNKDIWGEDIVRDLYYYPALKQFVDNIRYEASGLKDVEKFYWTRYVTAWQPLPEPYKGKENQTR